MVRSCSSVPQASSLQTPAFRPGALSPTTLRVKQATTVASALSLHSSDYSTTSSVMASSDRPPRPPNSWILYRAAKSKELAKGKSSGSTRLTAVSSGQSQRPGKGALTRVLARMWKDESLSVRRWFEDLAEEKKVEHSQLYPGYKYKPRRKKETVCQSPTTSLGRLPHGHNLPGPEARPHTGDNCKGQQAGLPQLRTTGAADTHAQQHSLSNTFSYSHNKGVPVHQAPGPSFKPVSLHSSWPSASVPRIEPSQGDMRVHPAYPALYGQGVSQGVLYSNVPQRTDAYQGRWQDVNQMLPLQPQRHPAHFEVSSTTNTAALWAAPGGSGTGTEMGQRGRILGSEAAAQAPTVAVATAPGVTAGELAAAGMAARVAVPGAPSGALTMASYSAPTNHDSSHVFFASGMVAAYDWSSTRAEPQTNFFSS
ncbi:hypothetical protein CF319_g2913 [Tilletia indica]|uniref:Uncharacterized protein n=1 Tax=Tilletia indica TaxID=43049 RepID=A0A177T930_9BASI|nr:hypothetical protein CF319_g2913 [Tilletia indica]KAE8250411.1 hypothetical protein A4X13_0g4749 [Tilletia indica]